ncbi:hypothetical protein SCUCBS95973_005017 [Sporothrix curviconia]|uniref:Carboxylesterase type B domain-containing protein n=1 Tax=Sporothrix curviconia TaxID=1260050 RepID=A0ABP0BV22_9PEZI
MLTFVCRLALPLVSLVVSATSSSVVNEPRSTPLPILKLPYASYQASGYNSIEDIYTFSNIRYAAPPVGNLRWAKPAPPLKNTTLQDGSYGHACVQAAVDHFNVVGSGNGYPLGAAVNQFISGIPVPRFNTGDEDCLFLDVYVPGKALKSPSTANLPVVVWIYGGAFVLGSKDSDMPALPFYDGSVLISQSGLDIIFVTMNYRLGAYGFLAGTTMEREGLMQGCGINELRSITAMGESAGAGSLVHHLVAQGGTLEPLFKRAIIQSPAYQWMWDRAGKVEGTFQAFASLANCDNTTTTTTLDCLRNADAATLQAANTAVMSTVPAVSFAVGPTVDGSLIRQLPVLELASGNFAKGVESLLLSHCSDEATLFVSGSVATDAAFASFLNSTFPNYTHASVVDKILAFYPPVVSATATAAAPTYATESERFEAFLRDSCFTCSIRYINEAVGDDKVWNMQYAVSPGWHGTDLLPTFFNARGGIGAADTWLEDLAALAVPVIGVLVVGLSVAMQSYFASFATTGNPNTHRVVLDIPPTIQWNHPNVSSEGITGVLNVGDLGFGTVSDSQNQKTPCDFWRNVAAAVTNLGGYAPPGAVVQQSLVTVTNDPSGNYVGGNSG